MKNELMKSEYPCHIPERTLDDQILVFDLAKTIERIKQEDPWRKGDRNAITLLKNGSLRIVLIALRSQSEINFNQSGNMLSVQLIEGSAHINMKNQWAILRKGALVTLHEDVKHSLIALEESVILLTIGVIHAK